MLDQDVFEITEKIAKKTFRLNNELLVVLKYLERTTFSLFFLQKTNMNLEDCRKIVKYQLQKYNHEVQKFGIKKMTFENFDIKNDVFLGFLDWNEFPKEDKFLCLKSYFGMRIEGVNALFNKVKDIPLKRITTKFLSNTAVRFSKLFQEYAYIIREKNKEPF